MGDLAQCNFFKTLINDCNYQNQKLTVTIEQDYDLEWKMYIEPFKNKLERNVYFQPKNPYNRDFYKQRNNSFYHMNQNIHFPGKIYKPFWQNQKINDSQVYTNSKYKKQGIPHYFNHNQTIDFQRIQHNQNNFLEKFHDFSQNYRVPPGITNFASKNEQIINESKIGSEEEKKRILKEKLLSMFKNINQNKFI